MRLAMVTNAKIAIAIRPNKLIDAGRARFLALRNTSSPATNNTINTNAIKHHV